MRKILWLFALAAGLACGAAGASAQIVRFGTIAGGAALPSGLHEAALGAVLELQPVEGLSLGAHPTWARVAGSATGGSFSSSGLTDLPVDVGYWRSLPGPLSPGLGASLGLSLPVGDTAQGLGSGQTSVGGSLGVSLSPVDRLSLGVDAWRELSGSGYSSALSGPHATSLSVQGSFDATERANVHAGFATDAGATDSLGTPRSLMAGFTLPIAGRVALSVDGSHGLTSAAPSWVLSVGLGTAFAGLNPIGANSPVSRLATALGHGVNRGRGRGHVGGTKITHGRSGA